MEKFIYNVKDFMDHVVYDLIVLSALVVMILKVSEYFHLI